MDRGWLSASVAVLHAVSSNGAASKAVSRRFKIGDLSRGNILESTRLRNGLNTYHIGFAVAAYGVYWRSLMAQAPPRGRRQGLE